MRFAPPSGRGARPAEWPRRASFFAVPSLSPSFLDVLSGIGEVVELDLFVLNPCREYWGDIYSRREIGRRADGADPGERYLTEGNELLAAWGRAGRDTVDSLVEIAGDAEERRFVRPDGARRLAAVQRDVLDLRLASEGRSAEAGEGRDGAPEGDDSIRIHVCHSPVREAEVLHDSLLGLFDANPDLAPAGVLVLTPDLERYGPAVEAVFGAAARIPFHVARRRCAASPAVRAFLELLAMRRSRFAAEAVLAPLDTEAVRARFGIGESDLPAIRGWVREAGIRWGVDAAHREAEGLPASGEHAWRQGLDRLLLGYALPARNDLVAGLVPCPPRVGGFETGAEEGALLGRFVTYCEGVFALRSRLAGERHPREWAAVLREELGRFFAGGGSSSGGGGSAPGPASGPASAPPPPPPPGAGRGRGGGAPHPRSRLRAGGRPVRVADRVRGRAPRAARARRCAPARSGPARRRRHRHEPHSGAGLPRRGRLRHRPQRRRVPPARPRSPRSTSLRRVRRGGATATPGTRTGSSSSKPSSRPAAPFS